MSEHVGETGTEEDVPLTELTDESEESKSLFEGLRRKRDELKEKKEVDITLPGYDQEPPILSARYRLLDGPEVDHIARKIQRETKDKWQRVVLSSMDTFIAACVGMFVDLGDGKLQPMTLRGVPIIGYSPELAEAMGFEAHTGREVVAGVFAGNEIAITTHSVRLGRWMGNTSVRVDEDFLGEG